jgi:hypothetical protein
MSQNVVEWMSSSASRLSTTGSNSRARRVSTLSLSLPSTSSPQTRFMSRSTKRWRVWLAGSSARNRS